MMSSEEDIECFGLYGDKILKKTKRTRQRVDAGEPRNSYSSIPNFSSRPSFMSGGLYGAIFSQNQQHFGLFGPNFGPAKMLNELLGRQVKQAHDATGPSDVMVSAMDPSTENINSINNKVLFDSVNNAVNNSGTVIRENSPNQQSTELAAHHMLRDILQGRKKELMALEQELRSANNSAERASPDNNNSIKNNNNNDLKRSDTSESSDVGNGSGDKNSSMEIPLDSNSADEASQAAAAMQDCLQEAGVVSKQEQHDLMEEAMIGMTANSDSEHSMPPSPIMEPLVQPKVEIDVEMLNDKEPGSPGHLKSEPVPLDMKRARVENIVSTMRSSPALPTQPQVNGCKKRKLYHPQQHDNSAAERYAAGMNLGMNLQSLMLDDDDDEELEPPQIHQKRVEKNALKSQLRTMQEQLAEMQQKYVQLCTRMEQESETQEAEEITSDIEQDANSQAVSEKVIRERTPPVSPAKESPAPLPQLPAVTTPNMLSQVMSKMMSAKMHPQLPSHSHMPPNFNGAHPLLQHMAHGPPGHGDHPHPMSHPQHPHPHHAISNAAAMYLGVSQKLFLEQEARMAKEAAVAAAVAAEQHQAQQQHHQQQQQAAQQQQQAAQQQQQQQQQQQAAQQQSQQNQHSPQPPPNQPQLPKGSTVPAELTERLNMMRNSAASVGPVSGSDLEGLADVLKSEITASLSNLVDSIVTRFVHQRRYIGKQSEAAAAAAEQLNKDLMMASQLLDRKSPRTKVAERNAVNQTSGNGPNPNINNSNNNMLNHPSNHMMGNPNVPRMNGNAFPPMGMQMHVNGPNPDNHNHNQMNLPPHVRPSPSAAMFQAPKPPQGMNSMAAAALYNSMNLAGGHVNPFCMPEQREQNPEQNEALSLVVTPKKKRHKVTDTRITPRTVSRILAQDGIGPSPGNMVEQGKYGLPPNPPSAGGGSNSNVECHSPRSYHAPPPPMIPVSLPTSVAIPNPSLHESQVFSPYSPFFNPHHGHHGPHGPQSAQLHHMNSSSSPPGMGGLHEPRDSPPLPHPPTMLHPALLAAAHHGGSPDYGHIRAAMEANDRNSDCNSGDISYDGIQPTSSTLTPMHLRKAKLMFFWVRYPSSAVLKMYFPDIKFNKNNTAQLVKWFSNFREFYYIQMEKYARQAVSEGVKNADDLHVGGDSEIYRVLNLHYNRNNHIEVWGPQVPSNFRYVVEQTLREFFKAIQGGKDTEQSWKKSIYKIISRLDDPVPEYFKSPNFLEQLE